MTRSACRSALLFAAIISIATTAAAQTRLATNSLTFIPPAVQGDTSEPPLFGTSALAFQVTNRPCEGCPPRRVWRSVFQTTWVNVAYGLANLMRGHDTAK